MPEPKQKAIISYRFIGRWKYQTEEFYSYSTGICIDEDRTIGNGILKLCKDGLLIIDQGYAWDGPSGPTLDTKDWMRASLVHDALYQLIREGVIPESRRKKADKIMKTIMLEDGMPRLRAWYSYVGVRIFGSVFAQPTDRNVQTAP